MTGANDAPRTAGAGTIGAPTDPLEPVGWDDPLTGAEGPRFWSRLLDVETARSKRYQRPLTVAIVELAGAGNLARTWGPDVAQQAIVALGRCLRRSVRTSDHLARIAPFRFGMLLTETGEVAAINLIERVRESCPAVLTPITAEHIRLAFGWASPAGEESVDEILARASRILDGELRDDVSRGPA